MDPASTSFVLGYHGCDHTVAERIFAGKDKLRPSDNDYDWLGGGTYFWEHNAQRAFEFAVEVSKRAHHAGQKIRKPAVVGAIIDLGLCLNLLDSRSIAMVRLAYRELVRTSAAVGVKLPENTGGTDLLKRDLDCAVIRTLHQMREVDGEPPFDTVRAAFFEGDRLYENAGFAAKNHIQICVRNPACIKGCFRPLDEEGRPMKFR